MRKRAGCLIIVLLAMASGCLTENGDNMGEPGYPVTIIVQGENQSSELLDGFEVAVVGNGRVLDRGWTKDGAVSFTIERGTLFGISAEKAGWTALKTVEIYIPTRQEWDDYFARLMARGGVIDNCEAPFGFCPETNLMTLPGEAFRGVLTTYPSRLSFNHSLMAQRGTSTHGLLGFPWYEDGWQGANASIQPSSARPDLWRYHVDSIFLQAQWTNSAAGHGDFIPFIGCGMQPYVEGEPGARLGDFAPGPQVANLEWKVPRYELSEIAPFTDCPVSAGVFLRSQTTGIAVSVIGEVQMGTREGIFHEWYWFHPE